MIPLFSTAYFPPIGYVAALIRHNIAYIETKETFPKQTYRNRTEIMTAGGVRALIVPVKRTNHSRTEEVIIDYSTRWATTHLRTIEAAYAASPYYMYYRTELTCLLSKQYSSLLDLNTATTTWVLEKLKVPCDIKPYDKWNPDYPNSFRNNFSPKDGHDETTMQEYYQVFSDRIPFTPNLSILDLLFNLGPEAKDYLHKING